jgi:hypothetical protein
MRRKYHQLLLLALSALLTIMGAGSCKTTKIGKKARLRQQQAYLDSLSREAAEAEKAARAAFLRDSLENAERIRRNVCVYGGPNMMGRRILKPDSVK